jgi:hypothetical protein
MNIKPYIWNSMESAPKDGSRIIVFDQEFGIMAVEWTKYRYKYPDAKYQFDWCVPNSEQDEQGGMTTSDSPMFWMKINEPLKK